jgi:methylated-DNA-[protein]-cysteine S-methyltransferase
MKTPLTGAMSEDYMCIYYFNTKIGRCGIAWSDKGIDRVLIGTRETASNKSNPPQYVRDAAKRIAAHLAGESDDLRDIKIDLAGFSSFTKQVYAVLRKIGPGEVTTYGELARRAGSPRASRAVGRAMATNPIPLIIPCHRVIASDGSLGGFSAPGGTKLKRRLLCIERSFQRR